MQPTCRAGNVANSTGDHWRVPGKLQVVRIQLPERAHSNEMVLMYAMLYLTVPHSSTTNLLRTSIPLYDEQVSFLERVSIDFIPKELYSMDI
jgi:hypothetical protein